MESSAAVRCGVDGFSGKHIIGSARCVEYALCREKTCGVPLSKAYTPLHICARARVAFFHSNSEKWLGRHARKRSEVCLLVNAAEKNSKQEAENSSDAEADVEALEAKIGIGRRARKERAGDGSIVKSVPPKPKPKDWQDMDFLEKAWSLYIGEKGILFWLNKLAYGAIFTIIGGWILFRFIGPALGWYELDSPLLPPDRVFGG